MLISAYVGAPCNPPRYTKGHFTHGPRAVTMKLWEPKRKCPNGVSTHLQNHVVWSRTLKCSVKSYVTGTSTKCYFNEWLFIDETSSRRQWLPISFQSRWFQIMYSVIWNLHVTWFFPLQGLQWNFHYLIWSLSKSETSISFVGFTSSKAVKHIHTNKQNYF